MDSQLRAKNFPRNSIDTIETKQEICFSSLIIQEFEIYDTTISKSPREKMQLRYHLLLPASIWASIANLLEIYDLNWYKEGFTTEFQILVGTYS